MESETRRIFFAVFIAMGVFLAYRFFINQIYPPSPPPRVVPQEPQAPGGPASAPGTTRPAEPGVAPAAPGVTTTGRAQGYLVAGAEDSGPIELGGRDGDALRIELRPRGATVASLRLYQKNSRGQFVHRTRPGEEQPYELLFPVKDRGQNEHLSFGTHRVCIKEFNNQYWRLDDLPWRVAEQSPEQVVFATTLGSGEADGDLLRFTKTYRLHAGQPVFDIDLTVENAGADPLTVWIEQDGPIGVRKEHIQYDMRRLLTAQYSDDGVELNKGYQHGALQKATNNPETGFVKLLADGKGPFLWTVLANKFFGVYTRPLPRTGSYQDYVASVSGLVADRTADANNHPGDLRARIMTTRTVLRPGGAVRYPFEVYAGPKDASYLRQVDPAYADHAKLYYQIAQSADTRCCCTFDWLRDLMVWLLETIHHLVRNYGVAIIILVIIIRTLLHPLTVFQQKSMFRMQEAMAKIQPRLNELKEKYANDKVKQNQEMMKLFGEEGVNPAANFVSFIPLVLQMPILIALWTSLNTDVNLRHAPFDGWWIIDLSAPDAFWTFPSPIDIPVLSGIPFIGRMFTDIPSLNLLPILMGISMWLQQKYMPKPHLQAKLEAAKKQPAQKKKARSGMSPQDQLRQQQIMMYMMSIMFPLMFYYMPSGLNLYWMATNVFGIGESLVIRRQLKEDKKRRERLGPRPPKKPGLVGRFFKHIASQAEQLQHKADELSKADERKKKKKA